MSRTLFLYVFKDLTKYFLLAAVALSAIMSFGGLLKPLTKQGLDISQVGWMLTYLMPAMMTYSLPIAALFATTMVYGRLAADNELTACRASGISYLSMTTPAVLLGLTVAIVSLLFLCFIVPLFTLQVERVLYSNIAQLVVNRIDRDHAVPFNDVTIYADAALLPPAAEDTPGDVQIVQLINPTVVTLERVDPSDPDLQRPRDFYTARYATAFIREQEDGDATLEVLLEGGSRFPRNLAGGSQIGIGRTVFGPIELPSTIRENSKFMNIGELKSILRNPLNSREISRLYSKALRDHRMTLFAHSILERLNGPSRSFTFVSGDERTTIQAAGPPVGFRGNRIVITYPEDPENRPVGFIERDNGSVLAGSMAEIHIGIQPADDGSAADIVLEMHDAVLQTAAGPTHHARFMRTLRTELPSSIVSDRNLNTASDAYQNIHRRAVRLYNDVLAEIHARVSFAISCLILVMVGCALGIMFRSGNFLSAFAVSVIPAVLCVALIVTGQHTAKNIPSDLSAAGESLRLGLLLIWSGNVATLLIAISLLWKLQRQ